MKKEEIHLWDIKRILLGQAPPEFLLEVLIRSVIIYILAIVVMRWLGKRMNGQLSIVELSVMVMMGAVLAVPMQLPDRGLLQGLVVLLCVLLLFRGLNLAAYKNSRMEKLVQGEMDILVKDGVLQVKTIRDTRISKPQLFAVLRGKQIYNLAKVKRMYIEACGTYSIYTEEKKKPGLLLFPRKDGEILDRQQRVPDALVCTNCGWLQHAMHHEKVCPNCGEKDWTEPII